MKTQDVKKKTKEVTLILKTKDKVLDLLKSKSNSFVSGEEIASELFLTRAAVWKAIKNLREDGHRIEAVTNRGYSLILDYDMLSKEVIDDVLEKNNISIKTVVMDEINSTNTYAKECADNGMEDDCVYIANFQSGGRGRRGRNFFSPKGTGVYFSFLLHPRTDVKKATGLTCKIAVAACKAIEKSLGIKASIKWVNDLYYKERKVSGILSEAYTSIEDGSLSYVIVGIGINVYEPADGYPDEIKNVAGALLGSSEKTDDARNRLVAETISEFMKLYNDPGMGYTDEYRERSFLIGNYVQINPNNPDLKKEYALVTGIDDECRLLVKYDDGREAALSNGEVSVVKY